MKIGTVGTNFVVDNFVHAARAQAGVEVVCCYSRTAETAAAFAEKENIGRTYTDKAAFLADPDIDFVYVASPNSLHYDWSLAALEAGKNVLCEKPFMSTVAEVEKLTALAKEKGLFLIEAVTVPHMPNYKLLKEHLGEIGDIKIAQLNFSQYSSRYDAFVAGKNPNIFNPEFSGGALMDINYYNLNFAVGLFGIPRDIKYYPNKVSNGIDTSGVLILQYDGFVCTAVGAKDSKSKNGNQIQGTKGFIEIPAESSRCLEFTVYTKDKTETYNVQQDPKSIHNGAPISLYYEMVDYVKIYNERDFAERDRLLDYSLSITRLVEKARKEAGIFFAADERKL